MDQNKDLCSNVKVQAMPTFIFYKKGKEMERVRGANLNNLKKAVESLSKLA